MKKPGTTTRRNGTVRCAIYTRKSSEEGLEQEFNSLQAQREACEAFIDSQRHEGWVCLADSGDLRGFSMSSREQVDAWHKAGVANGGASIEDPPGVRQGAAGQMYLAYLRDPDGNKVVAVHRMPAA